MPRSLTVLRVYSSALAAFALLTLTATTAFASGPPVVLIKPAHGESAREIAASHGLTVGREFDFIGWSELQLGAGDGTVASAAKALKADPAVDEVDAVTRPGDTFEPALQPRDTWWLPPWNSPWNIGGETVSKTWGLERTYFRPAWDRSRGDGALIGIIDSEFDQPHKELETKIRFPFNAESDSPDKIPGSTGSDITTSDTSVMHGTHVAGIAAAVPDNLLGATGAGYNANIVPAKVPVQFDIEGSVPVDARWVANTVSALSYLSKVSGLSVINISLGSTTPHPALESAIAAARGKGITIVAAAGNEQNGPFANQAVYPASYPGVVAVANSTWKPTNEIHPASQQGSWVDIAAPGTDILAPWDNDDPEVQDGTGPGRNFAIRTGTSMSAPLVSGLVALMKSARPDLTPDEVEALIKQTALDLGSAGPDPIYGAGLINADQAVKAAVEFVRPASPPPSPAPVPAPAPSPSLQKFGTTVTVTRSGSRRSRVYSGRIISAGRGCKSFRRVVLRRAGGTARVAQILSRGDGTFRFSSRRRIPGKVQVAVTERKSGFVLCRTAKSRTIRG